ncbi:hypothetical protein [Oceanobacillus sp. J11TS1]|uniref:hypothetical protein n=1 Tax=Oceanobacillus sp. J11TS1 TaxID=2807191 RepID=UPI001B14091E|nr:hypothetical protein [Oceanobacillus sp. J11TS1]GIO21818.1 hypothetical protein J11TS1_03990 [Oceanobacillus sp. J11TS1]
MHRETKHNHANNHSDLFNIDFHHFTQMEQSSTYLELATELGISIEEVKKLKKKLYRS